jgi:hypothetical protein
MKLIAVDEMKLATVLEILEPMISQERVNGCRDKAEQLVDLKNYLRTRLEMAPEIHTASSMGKKGGRSRSHRKLEKAKENAKKAGPPGDYYACLVVAPAIPAGENADAQPRKAIYYRFHDKQSRDEWVGRGLGENQAGCRESIFAIDKLFSSVKRKDPSAIAAGDKILQAELERDRLWDQFERCHDIMQECDGCGDLIERRFIRFICANVLCLECVKAIR